MAKTNYCDCGTPWLAEDDSCSKCKQPINPVRLASLKSKEAEYASFEDDMPESQRQSNIPKIKRSPRSKDDQLAIGMEAAHRTEKYATLFEKIGEALFILNTVVCVLAGIGVLVLDIDAQFKVAALVAIILVWASAYIQTALIRGVASYFQMRSSDFKMKYWK